MKHPTIASVEALSYRATPATVWTFAKVTSTDGAQGWGEGTLEGKDEEVAASIRALEPRLRRKPIAPDSRRWLGSLPTDLPAAAAYSAIEQALTDLAARAAGRSVCDFLGGRLRDVVPLYANINRGTRDRSSNGFSVRAAEAAAFGFGAVKIAPFDDLTPPLCSERGGRELLARGYDRIAAATEALAGRAQLMVDCHWRLSEAAAEQAIAECARLGVTWFECPLVESGDNLAALRRLRGRCNNAGMRLAGAERFVGVEGFLAVLDAELYDVVMPDLKYAGGFAECLRIGELADRHGCAVSLHNPSGPVCHAHSVHFSAAWRGHERLEYQYGETPAFYSIAPGLPSPQKGTAVPPPPLLIQLPMETAP